MTEPQPTASQLARLPLRAIVAYALRAAQRALTEEMTEYNVQCNCLFDIVAEFITMSTPNTDLAARVANSAAGIAEAEALEVAGRRLRVGLSARAAARCCYYAFQAAMAARGDAIGFVEKASNAAVMAARQLDGSSRESASADYQTLTKVFAKEPAYSMGPAFDPSGDGPLGPLQLYRV